MSSSANLFICEIADMRDFGGRPRYLEPATSDWDNWLLRTVDMMMTKVLNCDVRQTCEVEIK